jgi:hypothetical protein
MAHLEVADVFRQFGPSYLEAFGDGMLPSHRRAIEAIVACRTPAMGGHVLHCGACGETFYIYHACRNRACPACHTRQTRQWLEARSAQILPCTYHHVCITVPKELRAAFRANQRGCYGLFMKAAAAAVLELCADKRHMGAKPAVLSVLHTWNATMGYHPHVHLLVSSAGIDPDGASWRESAPKFLVPVHALSRLVRGKFMAMLQKACPDIHTPIAGVAWKKKWVVWSKPWGKGETAVLEYLARYVHRVAITNARILAMDAKTVTFRYKDRKTGIMRTCTVSGHEFMRRFLQHVLPRGFHKVRYYGLWHSSRRAQRENLRLILLLKDAHQTAAKQLSPLLTGPKVPGPRGPGEHQDNPPCPYCGSRETTYVQTLYKTRTAKQPRASPRPRPPV